MARHRTALLRLAPSLSCDEPASPPATMAANGTCRAGAGDLRRVCSSHCPPQIPLQIETRWMPIHLLIPRCATLSPRRTGRTKSMTARRGMLAMKTRRPTRPCKSHETTQRRPIAAWRSCRGGSESSNRGNGNSSSEQTISRSTAGTTGPSVCVKGASECMCLIAYRCSDSLPAHLP